jgi:hypothetical protein
MIKVRMSLWFIGIVWANSQAIAIVPVIDAKAILGTLKNTQVIEEMKNISHGDMEKLRGEFDSINPLGFKKDSLNERVWSENSWKSALSDVETSKNFKKQNRDIYEFSNQSPQQPEIESTLQTNSVLETESAAEYDRLLSYTTKINELSNKIQTAASAKSALDINNKLLVEIAYLEVEMIHMQAIGNQAVSWRMHHDLELAANADKFLGEVGGK